MHLYNLIILVIIRDGQTLPFSVFRVPRKIRGTENDIQKSRNSAFSAERKGTENETENAKILRIPQNKDRFLEQFF